MTHPVIGDVEALARSLTKAQREAVLLVGKPSTRTTGPGKGLFKSATLRPLLTATWRLRKNGRYIQTVSLTALGLVVREYLLANDKAEG